MRNAGSSTLGDRDSVTFSGPDRSRHEARRASAAAFGQPRALEVHVADGVLQPVVGLADRGGRERVRGGDVGAGLEVGLVDLGDDVWPREVQQVGVALDVAVVVREAVPAEVLLGQALALQQHAPGAVEQHDALGEQVSRRLRASCGQDYRH